MSVVLITGCSSGFGLAAPGTFATQLAANASGPPTDSAYGTAPAKWYTVWEGMLESNPGYSGGTAATVQAATAADPRSRHIVPASFTTEAVVAIREAKNALHASMRA